MNDTAFDPKRTRTGVIAALLAVYLSWGSTYLVIRIALQELPPFFMMGIRFFLVGIGLYVVLWLRGAPAPTGRQWGNAALIGAFLFLGGSAGVAYAEQSVGSGLAALVIATTPLWTVLFSVIWKDRPSRLEWAGLLLGLLGIALLNLDNDLQASPLGFAALVLAALSWAFGSVWSRQLSLPKGQMAGAAQMICGGAIVLLVSAMIGERLLVVPTWRSIGAVVYLAIVGSLIGFTAYVYLLTRVRPALATSYAYVNPVIAVALGVWILDEQIGRHGIIAMVIIVASVALVVLGQRRS